MNVRTPAADPLSPEAVSVPDAARCIGVSRTRIYQMISAGELATVKIGRRRLVRLATLRRLLASLEA